MAFKHLLLSLSLLAGVANAVLRDGRRHGNVRPSAAPPKVAVPVDYTPVDPSGNALPPINTTYYFNQLIDHDDPSKGTFQQRYYSTWEFYETGGPIILFTPGEVNFEGYDGYLTNLTINGQVAQQEKGATVVLEHRFFGLSNPYNNLSVASLQLLTLDQSTADLAYFAENVNLPMPGGDKVAPGEAPWFLFGGSYSGALTSWTMVQRPGVFWAGWASSAVVEAITDFWAYFEPIRVFMAPNCSADVEAVIANVSAVVESGNSKAIQAAKDNWGLGELSHDLDFLGALRNNLWDWQSLQPDSGGGVFFDFCDALEVKDGVSAPAEGWGLEHAYTAWGNFWNTTYYADICGTDGAEDCLGSYNSSQSFYTDTSIDNSDRSWTWFVCNQVGFYQEGPPKGYPALVSYLLTPPYEERECNYFFPGQWHTAAPAPTVGETNAVYKGWNVQVDRLFFANGWRDPWRYATVRSNFTNVPSTSTQPIAIGDAFHTSDLITENGEIDSTVLAVQQEGLKYFAQWTKEWKPSAKQSSSSAPSGPLTKSGAGAVADVKKKPINAWYIDPITV